jgi:hypothetical protein
MFTARDEEEINFNIAGSQSVGKRNIKGENV